MGNANHLDRLLPANLAVARLRNVSNVGGSRVNWRLESLLELGGPIFACAGEGPCWRWEAVRSSATLVQLELSLRPSLQPSSLLKDPRRNDQDLAPRPLGMLPQTTTTTSFPPLQLASCNVYFQPDTYSSEKEVPFALDRRHQKITSLFNRTSIPNVAAYINDTHYLHPGPFSRF